MTCSTVRTAASYHSVAGDIRMHIEDANATTCKLLCDEYAPCMAFAFMGNLGWCRTFTDCEGDNRVDGSGNPGALTWAIYTKITDH